MRHVPLPELTSEMFARADGKRTKARLFRSHMKLVRMPPEKRQSYIRKNGPGKWSPIKGWLTTKLSKKCWCTEAELVGAPLAIDHFRPVCSCYKWLTNQQGITGSEPVAKLPLSRRFLRIHVMLFRCSASEFKQRLIIETTGLKRDFQSPSVFASRCDFTERQPPGHEGGI